jgi:gamma-glutamyltranspeptidase
MLAEYGTMSLKQVLAPAMQLAAGYPIEAQTANSMERNKKMIKQWPTAKPFFCRMKDGKEKHRKRRDICAERFAGNINQNDGCRTGSVEKKEDPQGSYLCRL